MAEAAKEVIKKDRERKLLAEEKRREEKKSKYATFEHFHLESELDAIHLNHEEIAEATMHNNKQLSHKFDTIDAKLEENELMGKAMHVNNATIKQEFAKINSKLDMHDQGLTTHHKALRALRSDMKSHMPVVTQGAVTTDPSAFRSSLNINELNRMARNF